LIAKAAQRSLHPSAPASTISTGSGTISAEIGGDLVMRIDSKDTLGWSNTIGRLLSSPAELAASETEIQKSYHPMTWDDSAKLFSVQ